MYSVAIIHLSASQHSGIIELMFLARSKGPERMSEESSILETLYYKLRVCSLDCNVEPLAYMDNPSHPYLHVYNLPTPFLPKKIR